MNNALAIPLRRARGGDGRLGSILSQSLFASDAVGDLLEDNLLRKVVYEGLREDKPAAEVRRAVPYPKPPGPAPSGLRFADGGAAALPDGLF
jgi:hypothetical protein